MAEKVEKKLTEEEQRVENKSKAKKISKEDAKKEVAKEKVQEKTGYSAEAMADVGRNVMKASEGFERPNIQEAADGMKNIQGNTVEGMLEKMSDGKVAEDIIKAGLGSEFLSTGKSGLEHGARTVLEKTKAFGEGNKMQQMLEEAAMYGAGLTKEEVENMTPEKLKERIDQYKRASQDGKKPSEKTEKNPEKAAKETTVDKPIIPTIALALGTKEEKKDNRSLAQQMANKLVGMR